MKKIAIAVAATLALTATVPAFAAMQMTGKLSGGFRVDNHEVQDLNPSLSGTLNIAAKEAGGWSAEAQLKNLASSAKLGQYKVEFNDPRFNLMMWGNEKETSAKSDPLGFIESEAQWDGILKTRASVGPVVVDVQDDSHSFLFAEKAYNKYNLGLVAHSELPASQNGLTMLGYGRTQLGTMTVDGEIGMTRAKNVTEDNIGYGVKAVAPLAPGLTGTVSYKARPVAFDVTDDDVQGVNELYTEAKYVTNGMTFTGSMKNEDGFSVGENEQVETQTWAANALMSGVEAGVSHTTDLSVNPTNKLTVKHGRQIAPAFMVTGNVELKSDKDGVGYEQPSLHDEDVDQTYFTATNYAALQLDGKYTGIKKLTVEPKATLVKGAENHSYTRLGSKASYQVSPNGKLTAEYVNERIDGNYNDSELGMNYEVKF